MSFFCIINFATNLMEDSLVQKTTKNDGRESDCMYIKVIR